MKTICKLFCAFSAFFVTFSMNGSTAEAELPLAVHDVCYPEQIDVFTPFHLTCNVANSSDDMQQAEILVELYENASAKMSIARTAVKTLVVEPLSSVAVAYDEYLEWMINWPPVGGIYELHITDRLSGNTLYNGSIELLAEDLSVNVEIPGTLQNYVSADRKYKITGLTLSGELNSMDIRLLRDMAGADQYVNPTPGRLSRIDMKDVRFVEGGESYYYDNIYGYQTTAPHVLPFFMFSGCSALQSFEMPYDTEVVAQWAFSNTSLSRIGFAHGLKLIGPYAFAASKVWEIELPDSLEELHDEAFANCTILQRVTIGKGLKKAVRPFTNCPRLEEFVVSEDNECFRSIEGMLFSADGSAIVSYPNARGAECVLPESTRIIGEKAFFRQECIKYVGGAELTEIGRDAFAGSSIESLDLGNSLQTIAPFAFYECKSLGKIMLPASLSEIGECAFGFCPMLNEVICMATVPPSVPDGDAFVELPANATLFVPAGSVESYRAAECWHNFKNIKPLTAGVRETNEVEPHIVAIFGIDGARLKSLRSGTVNILMMSDGSVRKVMK